MLDQSVKQRNALIIFLFGLLFLILGIYLVVRNFQQQEDTWYYWIGLILVGDILIILGIRMLKKAENVE